MPFIFFNELGVEPLAYVGKSTDLKIVIPTSIHYIYSGDKLNLPARYTCGRYVNTEEASRIINTDVQARYINTTFGGTCK